jgi:mono/diheme cytochrome c family protein
VRYAGGADYLPTGFAVTPDGVRLTFSQPLDPAVANELERYSAERWEYIYSQAYGSPEMSIRNPGREGRDPVAVTGASVSPDGKTLFLEIPDIMPVMQQKVGYNVRFADGHEEENAVYHTIHVLREGEEPVRRVRTEAVMPEEVDEWLAADEEGDLPVWFEEGRSAFETNCYTCHQPGGVAPAMRDSDWAGGSKEPLVRIVLHGKEGEQGIMTPFGWMDDGEIAAVLSYIRVRWHDGELVEEADVRRIREETGNRDDLWTAEELRRFTR